MFLTAGLLQSCTRGVGRGRWRTCAIGHHKRDLTHKLEDMTAARKTAEQSAAEWRAKFDAECESASQEAAKVQERERESERA